MLPPRCLYCAAAGRHLLAALILCLATGSHQPAVARTAVDLELVLSVDISYSMDEEEQRLQRDGYAQAFRSTELIRAIKSGPLGRIAVSYFEWAGIGTQKLIVPWRLLDGAATAKAFADELAKQPIHNDRRTSISAALEFARAYFKNSPFKAARRVIDISGDGPNNAGRPVAMVRDETVRQGFIINGLPIMTRPSSAFGRYDIPNLDAYYANCVIGGPGSFVIPIKSKPEFATATRRKLVLEIAAVPYSNLVIKAQVRLNNRPKADCFIGEQKRRDYDFWDDPL